MALVTVEGTYENGEIALAELPEGVGRSRVMVTFLPSEAMPAALSGRSDAEADARQRRREAGERMLEMMRRGIDFGGEKLDREEIYEGRMDELDGRRSTI